MNQNEFNQWFQNYCAVAPSTRDFTTQVDPSGLAVLRVWFDILKDCTLEDALRATTHMIAGHEGNYYPNQIPAITLSLCNRFANERRPAMAPVPMGSRAVPYECEVCSDTGMVTVWDNETMRGARNGTIEDRRGCYRTAVRCPCKAGNRYEALSLGYDSRTKSYRRQRPMTYNEQQYCRAAGFEQEEINKLIDFMVNWRPSNYEHSFDRFNEGR